MDDSRIKTRVVKERRLVAQLQEDFNLSRGEAAAIALALSANAQLIGIDDKNGINSCKLSGLAFTTALGILLTTRERGLLPGPEALQMCAQLAGYRRYRRPIIEDARAKWEAIP